MEPRVWSAIGRPRAAHGALPAQRRLVNGVECRLVNRRRFSHGRMRRWKENRTKSSTSRPIFAMDDNSKAVAGIQFHALDRAAARYRTIAHTGGFS